MDIKMTYLEWLKTYDKSHITHPSRQDVWDAAWNHQQEKLDKIKAIMDQDVYHIPTMIKEIKEILK